MTKFNNALKIAAGALKDSPAGTALVRIEDDNYNFVAITTAHGSFCDIDLGYPHMLVAVGCPQISIGEDDLFLYPDQTRLLVFVDQNGKVLRTIDRTPK